MSKDSNPNIMFITCDQMRADLMGCAGNPIIQTPHLDFLARRGVRFTNAVSPQPVCIPARAAIMTGLEGHRLGLTYYKEGFRLPVSETLPRQLGAAGYQTKAVGKMHVYPERCHYGFDSMLLCEEGRPFDKAASGQHRGYDDYEIWLAERGYSGEAFSHGMSNNEIAMTPWHLPDELHPTEWIGRETCKAIKNRDWTRPLFLWSSFTAPHPPLTPLMRDLYMYERDEMPKPVRGSWTDRHPSVHQANLAQWHGEELTDKQIDLAYRGFYALITQVDRQINRIIGTLREEGMLEDTWIIFSSDHGDNMGDHGLWSKSNLLRGSCNVPLIIAPPVRGNLDTLMGNGWMPGTVSEAVVGLQDIMPTCLHIAGTKIPAGLDGRSLLPVVQKTAEKVRDTLLGEFGPIGKRSFMLTDGEWKYIWYEEDGTELLFHVKTDRNELNDVSQSELSIRTRWQEKLIERLKERSSEPAVGEHDLAAGNIGYTLTALQKARMATDHNARGLH